MIFVFGSNLAGRHYGGAAREAVEHFGAVMGIAEGIMDRCYAVPTMDKNLNPLAPDEIYGAIRRFLEFANRCPDKEFFVTAVGCGIAGYTPERIAPMFAGAPMNCTLHRRLVEAQV